ncbi:uncharacterized protein LOC142231627 [Haematobia irritans]|uniref:uncharacterized protein LOC142231627 n=1 Tax=Haematobia irritans TaxID=7368 RepID=UPI003F4F59A0
MKTSRIFSIFLVAFVINIISYTEAHINFYNPSGKPKTNDHQISLNKNVPGVKVQSYHLFKSREEFINLAEKYIKNRKPYDYKVYQPYVPITKPIFWANDYVNKILESLNLLKPAGNGSGEFEISNGISSKLPNKTLNSTTETPMSNGIDGSLPNSSKVEISLPTSTTERPGNTSTEEVILDTHNSEAIPENTFSLNSPTTEGPMSNGSFGVYISNGTSINLPNTNQEDIVILTTEWPVGSTTEELFTTTTDDYVDATEDSFSVLSPTEVPMSNGSNEFNISNGTSEQITNSNQEDIIPSPTTEWPREKTTEIVVATTNPDIVATEGTFSLISPTESPLSNGKVEKVTPNYTTAKPEEESSDMVIVTTDSGVAAPEEIFSNSLEFEDYTSSSKLDQTTETNFLETITKVFTDLLETTTNEQQILESSTVENWGTFTTDLNWEQTEESTTTENSKVLVSTTDETIYTTSPRDSIIHSISTTDRNPTDPYTTEDSRSIASTDKFIEEESFTSTTMSFMEQILYESTYENSDDYTTPINDVTTLKESRDDGFIINSTDDGFSTASSEPLDQTTQTPTYTSAITQSSQEEIDSPQIIDVEESNDMHMLEQTTMFTSSLVEESSTLPMEISTSSVTDFDQTTESIRIDTTTFDNIELSTIPATTTDNIFSPSPYVDRITELELPELTTEFSTTSVNEDSTIPITEESLKTPTEISTSSTLDVDHTSETIRVEDTTDNNIELYTTYSTTPTENAFNPYQYLNRTTEPEMLELTTEDKGYSASSIKDNSPIEINSNSIPDSKDTIEWFESTTSNLISDMEHTTEWLESTTSEITNYSTTDAILMPENFLSTVANYNEISDLDRKERTTIPPMEYFTIDTEAQLNHNSVDTTSTTGPYFPSDVSSVTESSLMEINTESTSELDQTEDVDTFETTTYSNSLSTFEYSITESEYNTALNNDERSIMYSDSDITATHLTKSYESIKDNDGTTTSFHEDQSMEPIRTSIYDKVEQSSKTISKDFAESAFVRDSLSSITSDLDHSIPLPSRVTVTTDKPSEEPTSQTISSEIFSKTEEQLIDSTIQQNINSTQTFYTSTLPTEELDKTSTIVTITTAKEYEDIGSESTTPYSKSKETSETFSISNLDGRKIEKEVSNLEPEIEYPDAHSSRKNSQNFMNDFNDGQFDTEVIFSPKSSTESDINYLTTLGNFEEKINENVNSVITSTTNEYTTHRFETTSSHEVDTPTTTDSKYIISESEEIPQDSSNLEQSLLKERFETTSSHEVDTPTTTDSQYIISESEEIPQDSSNLEQSLLKEYENISTYEESEIVLSTTENPQSIPDDHTTTIGDETGNKVISLTEYFSHTTEISEDTTANIVTSDFFPNEDDTEVTTEFGTTTIAVPSTTMESEFENDNLSLEVSTISTSHEEDNQIRTDSQLLPPNSISEYSSNLKESLLKMDENRTSYEESETETYHVFSTTETPQRFYDDQTTLINGETEVISSTLSSTTEIYQESTMNIITSDFFPTEDYSEVTIALGSTTSDTEIQSTTMKSDLENEMSTISTNDTVTEIFTTEDSISHLTENIIENFDLTTIIPTSIALNSTRNLYESTTLNSQNEAGAIDLAFNSSTVSSAHSQSVLNNSLSNEPELEAKSKPMASFENATPISLVDDEEDVDTFIRYRPGSRSLKLDNDYRTPKKIRYSSDVMPSLD